MNQSNALTANEIKKLALTDIGQLFKQFKSSPLGLDGLKAKTYLKHYGLNQISTSKSSQLEKLSKMIFSPLPVLLIVLSTVSYLAGEKTGAIVIAVMVLLSILLTFFQEQKSNQAAENLKSLVAIKVNVFRNGQDLEIDFKEIVPGDVVLLSAGDLIPGDLRVIESKDLYVNEASLTGESLPVEKYHVLKNPNNVSISGWNNLCFMGTHVVSGIAKGLVLRTGINTFFGELVRDITTQEKSSAFEQGIKRYIWLMLRFILVMVPAIFLINGFMKGDWLEAALFAVALSVGLTPEMLPLLVTINLAKGALVMANKRVIVKRLSAIQNLGSMDVLCVDKTGTLTQDKIILESHVDVLGNSDSRVLEFAYLNSHYQSGLKNLLDLAVLEHAEIHEKLHDNARYKKVDEIPFDFERRRMSVIVDKNSTSHILICKGAVEEIFSCCKYAQRGEERIVLDQHHLEDLKATVDHLNSDGYRVIAVAIKESDIALKNYTVSDETEMILVGYIAFLDPPKDSAKIAINQLLKSGVDIKILTGDNERITRKVCSEVSLTIQELLLGSDIETMTDAQLASRVSSVNVFAKMSPHQKLRVIKILQQKGAIVGYLGDGINDGPSLRAADVSMSVDTAVDIAKESADIILLETNLQILYEGVLEGRRVFCNLMKYLKIASSSNLGNTLSMLGASALFPFLPMAPVQILTNDLLYDLSQSAVSTDNVDKEYLDRPKTWDMKSITHYMFFIGPISSLFDYLLFAYMWFVIQANTLEFESIFQTGWFIETLLSQTLIVHILRTSKIPFIQSTASPILIMSTVVISLIGIFLPYTALGEILKMSGLPPLYWFGLIILLAGYLITTQLIKLVLIKRFGLI